eukprot:13745075-Alexandrium_andersonii.AAC.1
MVLRHVVKPMGYSAQPAKRASLSWAFPARRAEAPEVKPEGGEEPRDKPKEEEPKVEEKSEVRPEGPEWLSAAVADDAAEDA